MKYNLGHGVELYAGDNRDALRELPADSLDSCVTDPPYALVSIVKRFGSPNAAPAKGNAAYMRASAGFMGKAWDTGEVAFSPEFWAEVLRVLKPGAHLVAFGATRGYHRMACAIEDAGFEIRDSFAWLYSTGFPKSHNLDHKRGDLICGCENESNSVDILRDMRDASASSAVAHQETGESILQRVVSQQDVCGSVSSDFGEGHCCDYAGSASASNDAFERTNKPGMEGWRDVPSPPGQLRASEVRSLPAGVVTNGESGRLRDGTSPSHGETYRSRTDADGMRASFGPQAAAQQRNESGIVAGQSQSQDGGAWPRCGGCGKPMVPEGWGTAIKPAFEPIVLARKPLSEGTVAANVLRWRTGALNIGACRVPTDETITATRNIALGSSSGGVYSAANVPGVYVQNDAGRWPANVVHDGSPEVVEAFPFNDAKPRAPREFRKVASGADADGNTSAAFGSESRKSGDVAGVDRGDSGSAARFFYSAKASKADRAGSKHPTVKPIELKRWLSRLITPPGGTVLDPFAGSGTTGAACVAEGFRAILCEREAEYVADIRRRLAGGVAPCSLADLMRRHEKVRALAQSIVDSMHNGATVSA